MDNKIDDSIAVLTKELIDLAKDEIIQNRVITKKCQILAIVIIALFIIENVVLIGILSYILKII